VFSVQLGSIYSGTAVRDAQTGKGFKDFTNQTEWSAYAKALNSQLHELVVAPLAIDESIQGKTVSVIGAAVILITMDWRFVPAMMLGALLGAAALGDIGRHFLDTDPRYKGIDSRILLRHAVELLAERGYRAENVDATVIAQKPKLAPYIDRMKENIAADLGVDPDRVNVKATTEERLGFTGREEGIAAHAVCLIEKADNSGGAD